jgi:hypothetical protein
MSQELEFLADEGDSERQPYVGRYLERGEESRAAPLIQRQPVLGGRGSVDILPSLKAWGFPV